MTTRKRATTGGLQLILSTSDIERLQSFYRELFGAKEYTRVPDNRRPFFVGLRVGRGVVVLVANKRGAAVKPGRAVLAIFVESVDDLLPRVGRAGGKVSGRAKEHAVGPPRRAHHGSGRQPDQSHAATLSRR